MDEVIAEKLDAPAPVIGEVAAGEHRIKVRAALQDDPESPVVVLAPAMGVPAGYYLKFVAHLHRLGLQVVSYDVRGQGETGPRATRGTRFGYQDFVDDLDGVLDVVDQVVPATAPRFALGHSLGGQITMLHTAAHPGRVRGAVLIASGSVNYRAYPGRLRRYYYNLLGPQAIAALSTLLGCWPGERFGFGGRQATGLMRDWARQGRTARWRLSGSDVDYDAALARLSTPLLTVTVDNDALAPGSAMDDLAGSTPAPRTRRHYSEADAGARLDHFKWARNAGELATWIDEWIRGVLRR
ncbi:alpha/beta fold hydrolase [Saccharopolyspora griseoalba]|uniref:Alpha/beta fold hydrolase n=1 Tax=Saccharopolyspora griseoalba TaxID=1431848 RepID=A0ABW2LQX7_9PSEU